MPYSVHVLTQGFMVESDFQIGEICGLRYWACNFFFFFCQGFTVLWWIRFLITYITLISDLILLSSHNISKLASTVSLIYSTWVQGNSYIMSYGSNGKQNIYECIKLSKIYIYNKCPKWAKTLTSSMITCQSHHMGREITIKAMAHIAYWNGQCTVTWGSDITLSTEFHSMARSYLIPINNLKDSRLLM